MDLEAIRELCLSLPTATEDMPFGPEVLTYKVANKLFALLLWGDEPMRLNVKCAPELAIELRQRYPESVLPGYHMNKKHWNTLVLDGRLSDAFIEEQIRASYWAVAPKVRKSRNQRSD